MKVYRSEDLIRPGCTVGIFRCKNRRDEPTHTHEFIEIVYVCDGSAKHVIDDSVYDVERGDILFIHYGSSHSFCACREFEYVNICFSPEVVADAIITHENAPAILSLSAFNEMRKDRNAGKLSFRGEKRREIEWLIDRMLKEYAQDALYANQVMENCMSILFTEMIRMTECHFDAIERDLWDELRDYIDENPDGELTLAALAKRSFYHPSYFSRMFKLKFGLSLTDYVARRRVDAAISLLSETDLSTEQIVRRAGFSDRNGYYHAFAKYTGNAPAFYRQKSKKS